MSNKEIKNKDKQIKRRIKQCGQSVENIHELAITPKPTVGLIDWLDEMYATLMASESPLAQDNDKRRESTHMYQIVRGDLIKLQAVEW